MCNTIKKVVLYTLYYLGVFRLIFFLNRNSTIIFMLHGVTDDQYSGSWRPLWKRAHTREIHIALKAIERYVDFVDMDHVCERLSKKAKCERPAVAFTFDDGYENNLMYAYPALRTFNAPMIVYFATSFVEQKQLFWIDEIDYLLQAQTDDIIRINVEGQHFTIRTTSRALLTQDYANLRLTLRKLYPDEREMLIHLNALKKQLDPTGQLLSGDILSNPMLSIIKPDVLASGLPQGFDVGSHTVNHLRLGNLERVVIDTEVLVSKHYLEEKTGQACRHFCYPVGSFSSVASASVKAAGYESAVTTHSGINRVGDDMFTLDRLAFPDVFSVPQVLFYVCWALVKDRVKRLRECF